MKKLDWYILKKFLGTFVFIMVLLLAITIVIDLSEKIDPFVANNATAKVIILDYYIYFFPYITSLIGPFFVLVSVIFFTSQLASRSEIIAILNSGTSFYRMLYPYFVGATILAVIFYFGNHYFVPYSNSKRIAFERIYVSKPIQGMRYNLHRMVEPGTIIYIENYKPSDRTGFKFSIDKFKDGKLSYKLRSEKIEWDSVKQHWQIYNYYERRLNEKRDIITSGPLLDTVLPFRPEDIRFTEIFKDVMTTPELKAYIDQMIKSGQPDVEFFEVERLRRTSSAFSIYILTLIGVSLASRKVRGGLGWHLVLGIGLSALYEIIMKFSVTFSTNSSLPPVLGVWIPNLLYLALAIYLMKKAPK
ncbi:MAG TPA: LptF/LptG family permease [Chitinophagales bacterium]|nr:LptF/LptG family permease [Chitinophagales bacterium]